MTSSRVYKLIAALLTAAILFLQGAPAFAQGGNGLSISPTKAEFSIDKGKSDLLSIQVKNLTQGKIIAKAFINDFEADEDTGNPKLIIDRSSEVSSSSIATFITGLEDVTLDAGQTKEVQLTIAIPDKAISGAYYGAIRFTSTPDVTDKSAAQVSLNASVASIVLIQVPGEITQKIQVDKAAAYYNGKAGSIFTKTPSQVGVTVKNLGNGFAKPFGKVLISNMFGKQVDSYEMNDTVPRGNVLPATTRNFKNNIKAIKMPGRYSIQANVSSDKGDILQVTSSFWFLPVWFIIVVLVVLMLIIGSAWYLYKRYISRSLSRRK